jgi:Excalibur calcium-binding domain
LRLSLRRSLAASLLLLALIGAMAFAQPASAFRDRDCSDFKTHRQAQRFFERHHPRRDPHRLDADHDGIACESLP